MGVVYVPGAVQEKLEPMRSLSLVHNIRTQFLKYSCRHYTSIAVIFSISPDCSLTQGWTGGVHSNFEMIKDLPPGSGKYGPH